jgi:hypothetical protein
MNAENRIKLEMATRVFEFSRANPTDNPGQEAAVTRLGEGITRARSLMDQEVKGQDTVHASVLTKDEIREAITEAVKLLAGVARAARVEVPGVVARFRIRRGRGSDQSFLARARVALEQATELKDPFTRFGMPQGVLEELSVLVQQFDAALNQKNAGFRSQVGASGDLEVTIAELMEIVKQLDALNRHRFRTLGELRSAWKNARDVHWPAGQEPKARKTATGGDSPAA